MTIEERGESLRERLKDKLARAAKLRCAEHGQKIIAVNIHVRENGWFDSQWSTCCDALQRQAMEIVKERY